MALALVALLTIMHGAQSQGSSCGPSAAPVLMSPACTERLLNLTACLTYVEEGSNLTRPRKGCCSSLASMVDDKPSCLCWLIGGHDDDVRVRVDTTRALMLPAVCQVDTPPMSLCAVQSTPMSSLAPSSGGPEMPEPEGRPPAGSGPLWTPGTPSATPPNNSSGDKAALGTSIRVFFLLLLWTPLSISLSH